LCENAFFVVTIILCWLATAGEVLLMKAMVLEKIGELGAESCPLKLVELELPEPQVGELRLKYVPVVFAIPNWMRSRAEQHRQGYLSCWAMK
jgi:hypothetical protein